MASSQSALDSLRTVEFRETLKGYHRDDVDEYLEKAAIEAEGLQEQLRQTSERLRQASERISELEASGPPSPAGDPAPVVADDTLQRTLLLAQKFVDETKADAEAQAAKLVADAEAHARRVRSDAEANVAQITADSERRLREEVVRLEGIRTQLSGDVDEMARHLEAERHRLKSALAEMVKWVDDNVKPAAALVGRPASPGNQSPGNQSPGATPSRPPGSPDGAPTSPTSPAVAADQSVGPNRTGEPTQPRPTGPVSRPVTPANRFPRR